MQEFLSGPSSAREICPQVFLKPPSLPKICSVKRFYNVQRYLVCIVLNTAASFKRMWRGRRRTCTRWGWFSLWFSKRTKVISHLVASLPQYLSAMEVNKGREGCLGCFKLGRFPQLLVFTRSNSQLLLSPPTQPCKAESR